MSRRDKAITAISVAASQSAKEMIDSMPDLFTSDAQKDGALMGCLLSAAAKAAVTFDFPKDFVAEEIHGLMDAHRGDLGRTFPPPPTEGQA